MTDMPPEIWACRAHDNDEHRGLNSGLWIDFKSSDEITHYIRADTLAAFKQADAAERKALAFRLEHYGPWQDSDCALIEIDLIEKVLAFLRRDVP